MTTGVRTVKNILDRFEFTAATDRFYNYCLWEYEPPASPAGKFRAANLLYHSFDHAGIDERAYKLVQGVRDVFGALNTVWGTKWDGTALKWEFYFYDYRRRDRERSISLLLQAIGPLVPCELPVNEYLHYFMFSIDIDNLLVTGARSLDKINMYIGNVGSTVSSGISYALTREGKRLENIYFFFDPRQHQDDIIGKICCSAFIEPGQIDIKGVLVPELADCGTICLANKQQNDCIYFSGITIDQLIWFLDRYKYPDEITAFAVANRSNLDHLLYDVGIDYRVGENGVEVLKSGYYGTF